jgi:hypothetical protein
MAAEYYVRFDENNEALNGIVSVWNPTKQEFVDTTLSPLQLGGVGRVGRPSTVARSRRIL